MLQSRDCFIKTKKNSYPSAIKLFKVNNESCRNVNITPKMCIIYRFEQKKYIRLESVIWALFLSESKSNTENINFQGHCIGFQGIEEKTTNFKALKVNFSRFSRSADNPVSIKTSKIIFCLGGCSVLNALNLEKYNIKIFSTLR